jgi:hypothetical protein
MTDFLEVVSDIWSPTFSPVSNECKKSDSQFICFIKTTKIIPKNFVYTEKMISDNFYFWILHSVACIIRIVGNTAPCNNFCSCSFYYSLLPLHVFISIKHLQTEYTILVFGNYYINVGSVVLYSIFNYRARSYGLYLYGKILLLSILLNLCDGGMNVMDVGENVCCWC